MRLCSRCKKQHATKEDYLEHVMRWHSIFRRKMDPSDTTDFEMNEFTHHNALFDEMFMFKLRRTINDDGVWTNPARFERAKMIFEALEGGVALVDQRLPPEDAKKRKQKKYLLIPGLKAFTYILLDPSRLPEKPYNASFYEFVMAVFYIGKATAGRPLDHVKNAKDAEDNGQKLDLKESFIAALNIEGRGVIVADGGDRYSFDDEAFLHEVAMMKIYPEKFLMNDKDGHVIKWGRYKECTSSYAEVLGFPLQFPDLLPNEDDEDFYELGVFCLWKKWKIFQLEKCSEIRFDNCRNIYADI
ncbi:hypothetical protein QR680_017857 [Steinernema hermaphroditum]|uniref:Uncharacterized protein n=1 Tax=Steinernema hermaphroditum TaxID=289476 RepID=A0AA39HH13_9BILA|nr:hypothetical protein QR680_017857 [Steinernema hermaphroditum]